MEQNAFVVGVSFVLPTNGDHQVKRVLVPTVKVVLNGVIEVKGETVAGLVSVSKRHGGRSVGPPAVVPLNAVGRHAVPRDVILDPQSRVFHSVN